MSGGALVEMQIKEVPLLNEKFSRLMSPCINSELHTTEQNINTCFCFNLWDDLKSSQINDDAQLEISPMKVYYILKEESSQRLTKDKGDFL